MLSCAHLPSAWLRTLFSLEWLESWFAKSALKNDLEIQSKLKTLLTAIQNGHADLNHVADRELKEYGKVVDLLTKKYTLHEKGDFFGNKELARQMEKTLDIAFALEAELKIIIKKDNKLESDPREVIEGIANTSQNAIQTKLAKENEGFSAANC